MAARLPSCGISSRKNVTGSAPGRVGSASALRGDGRFRGTRHRRGVRGTGHAVHGFPQYLMGSGAVMGTGLHGALPTSWWRVIERDGEELLPRHCFAEALGWDRVTS